LRRGIEKEYQEDLEAPGDSIKVIPVTLAMADKRHSEARTASQEKHREDSFGYDHSRSLKQDTSGEMGRVVERKGDLGREFVVREGEETQERKKKVIDIDSSPHKENPQGETPEAHGANRNVECSKDPSTITLRGDVFQTNTTNYSIVRDKKREGERDLIKI
jgi:hypothetical protein